MQEQGQQQEQEQEQEQGRSSPSSKAAAAARARVGVAAAKVTALEGCLLDTVSTGALRLVVLVVISVPRRQTGRHTEARGHTASTNLDEP